MQNVGSWQRAVSTLPSSRYLGISKDSRRSPRLQRFIRSTGIQNMVTTGRCKESWHRFHQASNLTENIEKRADLQDIIFCAQVQQLTQFVVPLGLSDEKG